jgi:superfamily II DNA/RNA helicase
LLLYVSRRKHAEYWAACLREEEQIRRVAFVHGGSEDREGVVERWRLNQLDIVVATSAFGLGMDKGDVRAVIHACVPETADRFYQEVGRGGRDGRASLSLVVYTDEDLDDAARLNRERIISAKRGLERWETMRATATDVPGRDGVTRIDLRARPSDVPSDSEANLAWNLRTLNLMARARLIEIESEPPPTLEPVPGESPEAFDLRAREAFNTYFSQALVRPKPGHRTRRSGSTRSRTSGGGRAARTAINWTLSANWWRAHRNSAGRSPTCTRWTWGARRSVRSPSAVGAPGAGPTDRTGPRTCPRSPSSRPDSRFRSTPASAQPWGWRTARRSR